MKTAQLTSLLILSSTFLFTSCNQTCYECEKYEYCITITNTCQQSSFDQCYETAAQRESARAGLEVTYSGSCYEPLEDKETLLPGNQIEICDKKEEVDDEASDLETTGYQCVQE